MEIRFLRLQWKSHELLRGVRVAVMLGALAALAYGWVDTRNSIQTYESATLERAALQSRINARAASEAMQATLDSIDFILKSAREATADSSESFADFSRRVSASFSTEVMVQLFQVDRDGYLVSSSLGAMPRTFVGDQDYFLELEAADSDRMVITPPRLERLNNHWTLLAARAVWHEGAFNGLVAMAVPLEAWVGRFRRLEIGQGDVLNLVDSKGRLIARTLEVFGDAGGTPHLTADFRQRLADAQGSYIGSTGFDGVIRVYGWSPVGNELTMLSGLVLDDVLKLVRTQRHRALLRATVLSTALVLSVIALLLALKRYQVAAVQLAAREAHYRKVVDTMVEGVMVVDSAQRIVSVNPAFCAITGYRRDEVLDQGFARLAHSEEDVRALRMLLESEGTVAADAVAGVSEVDFEGERPNGARYIAHARLSPRPDGEQDDGERVVLIADVTESRRRDREIWQRANFDALTGLANRALMQDRLERMIAHARRRQTEVTVLFLDLNRFKPVNDNFGHEIGDLLLIQVARRLESLFRTEDTVARLGGDEFVVLMPGDGDGAGARRAAAAIVDRLSAPFVVEGFEMSISASVGIARFPADGESAQALLDRADRQMYLAKRSRTRDDDALAG